MQHSTFINPAHLPGKTSRGASLSTHLAKANSLSNLVAVTQNRHKVDKISHASESQVSHKLDRIYCINQAEEAKKIAESNPSARDAVFSNSTSINSPTHLNSSPGKVSRDEILNRVWIDRELQFNKFWSARSYFINLLSTLIDLSNFVLQFVYLLYTSRWKALNFTILESSFGGKLFLAPGFVYWLYLLIAVGLLVFTYTNMQDLQTLKFSNNEFLRNRNLLRKHMLITTFVVSPLTLLNYQFVDVLQDEKLDVNFYIIFHSMMQVLYSCFYFAYIIDKSDKFERLEPVFEPEIESFKPSAVRSASYISQGSFSSPNINLALQNELKQVLQLKQIRDVSVFTKMIQILNKVANFFLILGTSLRFFVNTGFLRDERLRYRNLMTVDLDLSDEYLEQQEKLFEQEMVMKIEMTPEGGIWSNEYESAELSFRYCQTMNYWFMMGFSWYDKMIISLMYGNILIGVILMVLVYFSKVRKSDENEMSER